MALSSLPHDVASIAWTADVVRALPDDGNRYEVIDGSLLVTPSPAAEHQTILMRLAAPLWNYLRSLRQEDALYPSPADISWNQDTLVQPDIFIVAPSEIGGGWPRKKTLLLAIEIVSPSSRRIDYIRKRELYQRYGTREYWIVDPERRHVEVWHLGVDTPTVVTATLTWHPDPTLLPPGHPSPEPPTFDLADLFRSPRSGG